MSDEEKSKVFGIRLTPHEREKYEIARKEYGFQTMAEFFRETANTYMMHPEIRDPTIEDSNLAEALTGVNKYFDQKEEEESRVFQKVTQNQVRIAILEKKIDLLLKQAKVDKIAIKEVEGKDIAEELIFDE